MHYAWWRSRPVVRCGCHHVPLFSYLCTQPHTGKQTVRALCSNVRYLNATTLFEIQSWLSFGKPLHNPPEHVCSMNPWVVGWIHQTYTHARTFDCAACGHQFRSMAENKGVYFGAYASPYVAHILSIDRHPINSSTIILQLYDIFTQFSYEQWQCIYTKTLINIAKQEHKILNFSENL